MAVVLLRETLLLVISPSLSSCQQTHEIGVSCSHLATCFTRGVQTRLAQASARSRNAFAGAEDCGGPSLGTLCTTQGHHGGFCTTSALKWLCWGLWGGGRGACLGQLLRDAGTTEQRAASPKPSLRLRMGVGVGAAPRGRADPAPGRAAAAEATGALLAP